MTGEFNPFTYFGALNMEVIPPEDEPAHPAIRRIFNNPLIPRKARSGSLRSPLKKKLPIKRVKLPVKKGIDY